VSQPGRPTPSVAHRVAVTALRPAAALVGRLRYAHKFVVVGLVLLIPLTLVAAAYVNLQRSQITFSLKERDGVVYLRSLVTLTGQAARARSELAAGRSPDLASVLAQGLAAVDAVDQRFGARLGVQDDWVVARSRLIRARSYGQLTGGLGGLVDLIVSVGDGSNLTLDPDLDTYYLMDLLQFRLPVLLEAATRGADQVALAGSQGFSSLDQRMIELGVTSGVLRSTLDTVDRGLATVAGRTGRGAVRRAAIRHQAELGSLVRQLDAAFTEAVGRRDLGVLPATAAEPLSRLVLRTGAEVAGELDLLLVDRVARFSARERAVTLGAAVTAALALYLFAGFYLSVVPPIRRIVSALGLVASGDLSQRVPVETRDELGVVARAFNETVALTEQATQRLAAQAGQDPLTGLPNRTLVLRWIEDGLDLAGGTGPAGTPGVAVLFLDLDRFKQVNDRQGHDVGDGVLCEVAARLRQAVGSAGLVARLAGDEFLVVLLRPEGLDPVLRLAEQLVVIIDRPFDTGLPGSARWARLGASIGVSVAAAGEPMAAEELVRRADLAMYEAKRTSCGRVQVFDERMLRQLEQGCLIEQDLREGIEAGQLVLHYQPVVESVGLRVDGYEALVRWQHPSRGLLLPGEFIDAAETSGLIVPLGAAVLDAACRQMAVWQAAARPDGPAAPMDVAVNVAAAQLDDPGFVALLDRILERNGVPPDRLWLELTERSLLADVDRTRRVLADLRRMGVRLAIDDFGTGYSSLAYLRQFPVHALKVDRSFVAGLGSCVEDEAIVEMLVKLADSMGLGLVAEGVETVEQAEVLRGLGCTWLQGYLFGRPGPAPVVPGGVHVPTGLAGRGEPRKVPPASAVPAPRGGRGVRSPG
jgi:diguanylate cyclase (GGDEF)-like protein